MESSLFGPDASDVPVEVIEEVGDTIEVWSKQFVNRWVFLKHQRPHALKELQELLACHTAILSTGEPSTVNGTDDTGPVSGAANVGNDLPIPSIGASDAGVSERLRERQAFGEHG